VEIEVGAVVVVDGMLADSGVLCVIVGPTVGLGGPQITRDTSISHFLTHTWSFLAEEIASNTGSRSHFQIHGFKLV
jgi:hypothetical protein